MSLKETELRSYFSAFTTRSRRRHYSDRMGAINSPNVRCLTGWLFYPSVGLVLPTFRTPEGDAVVSFAGRDHRLYPTEHLWPQSGDAFNPNTVGQRKSPRPVVDGLGLRVAGGASTKPRETLWTATTRVSEVFILDEYFADCKKKGTGPCAARPLSLSGELQLTGAFRKPAGISKVIYTPVETSCPLNTGCPEAVLSKQPSRSTG